MSILTRRDIIRMGAAFPMLGIGASGFANDGLDHPIVQKAKDEAKKGKFRIMVSSPKQEGGQKLLVDAFQKRFNLDLDWEWLPLTSPVSGPRVVELAKTGSELPSAIGGYGYNTYEPFIGKNKLAMEVDWLAEFKDLFPSIETATTGIVDAYSPILLRQWDVIYTYAYNTNHINAEQLPKNFYELTEDKWKAAFVMSNVNSSPLEIWGLDYEEEEVLNLVQGILNNKPRFKAGPPAAVGAVAAGEVPLALCGYTALAEAMRLKGSPIDWAPVDSKVFVQPLFVFVLKDAPLPNLGKLFGAWLCSEGRSLQEEVESLSMWGDEESNTMKRLRGMDEGVDSVMATDSKSLDKMLDLDLKIMDKIAGVSGKSHS